MRNVGAGCELYALSTGALPRDLAALLERNERSGEPYLDRIPLDAWQHPLTYRVLDAANAVYELRSAGADGRMNTSDDVTLTATAQLPR